MRWWKSPARRPRITSLSASDKIFVDKASIVGSIGVLMDGFGFTGLMDKLGVERRLMTAGENKGFLDPFSPQTDKHRAYAQALLDQIHQQFIDTVKAGPRQAAQGNAGTVQRPVLDRPAVH
jgi:ClpP class serine protease